MKPMIFTMMLYASLFLACDDKGDSDVTPNSKEVLLAGGSSKTWRMVINYSAMDECSQDNTLTFSIKGDLDYDIGEVVEGQSCSDEGGLVGMWDLISEGDSLQFTWTGVKGEEPYDDYFIAPSLLVKLTADSLKLRDDFGTIGFIPD